MGRTVIPPFQVEYTYVDFANRKQGRTTAAWPKELGKPTDAKAKQFREDFNRSLQAGGCNHHLRAGMGDIGTVTVRRNRTNGETVASFVPPMFEAI